MNLQLEIVYSVCLDGIMFDRQDEMGLEIVSVEEHSEMEVYNLTDIEDNSNFFVNGMLAHNFQNQGVPTMEK